MTSSNIPHVQTFKLLSGGYNLPLRPFEKVLKVVSKDDGSVVAQIETFRYTETTHRITLTKRGIRLYAIKDGKPSGVTNWFEDEDFEPRVFVKSGRVYEGSTHADRINFERDCYRPGGGRVPLDNYSRVLKGSTTEAMERYW